MRFFEYAHSLNSGSVQEHKAKNIKMALIVIGGSRNSGFPKFRHSAITVVHIVLGLILAFTVPKSLMPEGFVSTRVYLR